MAKKVPSLLDIASREGFQISENTGSDTVKSEIKKQKSGTQEKKPSTGNLLSEAVRKKVVGVHSEKKRSSSGKQKSEIPVPKSDYLKVTATMEPGMVRRLDQESWERRMAKLDFSYSAIIRDALNLYFAERRSV